MLTGIRGYNVHLGLYKTSKRERGLTWDPNSFDETRGDRSTELTYDQFCAKLAAAGVNAIRVKMQGLNRPMSVQAYAFEPPPAGTFNYWNVVLNPENLAQYRTNQHAALRPTDPAWATSNFGQLVTACDRHGIKLHIITFQNREFVDKWIYHAWNANNRYIDGTRCQGDDQGFIEDARDAFTQPVALNAARARIDAIVAGIEGYEHVVCAWEIMAEQPEVTRPPHWDGMVWGDAAHKKLVEDVRQWNEAICQYIQSVHDAPVGVSRPLPIDVRRNTLHARLFDVPSLDWIGLNWYEHNTIQAWQWMRDAQERYPGKQMFIQQYHPSGADTVPNEQQPYGESKEMEWVAACGEAGCCGGMRWMDTQMGTYASPWMAEIAGVTAQMAEDADLSAWGPSLPWDENIQSGGSDVRAGQGDGTRMVAFMRWGQAGQHTIRVSGLQDGQYSLTTYNYLTGERDPAYVVEVENGVLVDTLRSTARAVPLLLMHTDAPGPTPEPEPEPEPEPATYRLTLSSLGGELICSVPLEPGQETEIEIPLTISLEEEQA